MTLLNIQTDIDSQDFTLDQESYGKLIDYMNTLTPFEAIRYAAETNKMNGFEVVSRVEIAEWKSQMKNEKSKYEIMESQIMKNEKSKIEIMESKKSKVESFQNAFSDNEIVKNENENIKASSYQKAYMSMLSM